MRKIIKKFTEMLRSGNTEAVEKNINKMQHESSWEGIIIPEEWRNYFVIIQAPKNWTFHYTEWENADKGCHGEIMMQEGEKIKCHVRHYLGGTGIAAGLKPGEDEDPVKILNCLGAETAKEGYAAAEPVQEKEGYVLQKWTKEGAASRLLGVKTHELYDKGITFYLAYDFTASEEELEKQTETIHKIVSFATR